MHEKFSAQALRDMASSHHPTSQLASALFQAANAVEVIEWIESNPGCNLISDDNGRWAISTGGVQEVPEEGGFSESVAITSFVEPEEWKTSVIEAVAYAIHESARDEE